MTRQMAPWLRPYLAGVRALGVLTAVCGLAYPVLVTGIAQLPGLRDAAAGSLVTDAGGRVIGSALLGQGFTDAAGNPLPQYFQSRPSAAGAGYDPTASSASNLGPEDVVDPPDRRSLLTRVCARSLAVARTEGLPEAAAARPYCTPGGVGAVLAVFGPRDRAGQVVEVTRVVSVNEACPAQPFLAEWRGTPVGCARPGEDRAAGLVVPVRGDAPADPAVPPDAVTASASGLDPHISRAYARLQAERVARARGMAVGEVLALVGAHTRGRTLGFMGEPTVDVLALNRALDRDHPYLPPTPAPTPGPGPVLTPTPAPAVTETPAPTATPEPAGEATTSSAP